MRSIPITGVMPLLAVTMSIRAGGGRGGTNSLCAGPSRTTAPGDVLRPPVPYAVQFDSDR